jgi:hypothetical protein
MSRFVSLKTAIRESIFLKAALTDLNCEILRTRKIKTLLHRVHEVDVAVKTPFGVVGFIRNNEGVYELAGDDLILKKRPDFIEQLSRQYAYHKVLAEAKKAGFQLVKETTDDRQSIRLVLRKWS